jgi:hypothetical protein
MPCMLFASVDEMLDSATVSNWYHSVAAEYQSAL